MWAELAVHDHLSAKQRERDIRAAHVAGLKEALTLVDKERSEIGVVGDGVGDIICDHLTVAITARIKHLEEDQNG